ncbi:hypothetical protein ACQ4WX_28760 [Streptomyces lasalocidi]
MWRPGRRGCRRGGSALRRSWTRRLTAAATATTTTAAAPSVPSPVTPAPEAAPLPASGRAPAPASSATALAASLSASLPLYAEPEAPDADHTPARGFDAVAEEVLGDGPLTETAEGAELLTEPMTRINEAVRAGRIEAAAELTDRTVTEASTVLGPGHAEVLHLRELSAYIAYLVGEPVRAFEQSLDLARLRRAGAGRGGRLRQRAERGDRLARGARPRGGPAAGPRPDRAVDGPQRRAGSRRRRPAPLGVRPRPHGPPDRPGGPRRTGVSPAAVQP